MTPEGWRVEPLEALCVEKGHYGANVPKASFDPDLPRYVRITDIDENARLLAADPASLSEEDAREHILCNGDVLIARSGATVGKSYRYTSRDGRCAHAGYLIRFRTHPDMLASDFLIQYLRSPRYWAWVRETQRAQAQPNINAAEYGSLLLSVPPLGEQKKIAAILSSVDEAIEATQAVIDQLHVVKKAMMSELLTRGLPGRHTRFKQTAIGEVPEGWALARVDDLGTVRSGPFGSSMKTKDFQASGVPVLTIQSLGAGRILHDGLFFVDDEKRTELAEYAVRRNDLVFSRVADIGRCAAISDAESGWLISPNLSRIRLDPDKTDARYVMYALTSAGAVRRQIEMVTGDAGRPVISSSTLRQLLLPIPTLDEQRKIIEAATLVEHRLRAEEDERDIVRTLKAALMSVLLTGEVRVQPGAA